MLTRVEQKRFQGLLTTLARQLQIRFNQDQQDYIATCVKAGREVDVAHLQSLAHHGKAV